MKDGLFLAALVVLSALPYLGRLGFYSDDWAFLGVFSTATDGSFVGLLREQFGNPNLAMRPTQAVSQAILFRLFGVEPLGYHLVTTAALVAIAVLLLAVLRKLGLPRAVALAVPAVYVLMPNYSTARFWFAASGYLISMALYLGGLAADLRAASAGGVASTWRWKALAVAALLAAGLGFEVVIPLFVLNIVLVELVARRVHPDGLRGRLGRGGWAVFHATVVLLVVGVAVVKASVGTGVGVGGPVPAYLLRLVPGVLLANFGTYGAGLPHTAAWSVPHAGVAGVAAGLLGGVGAYLYLGRAARWDGLPPRGWWARLAAAGLGAFALGYAIFLVTGRIQFSSTGAANRVATVGALGAAMVVVAAAGWLAAWLRSPTARDRLFRVAVAVVCAAGITIVNGLAAFWAEGWERQGAVLRGLHWAVPEAEAGTSILLAGACPYVGPGIVFESTWDLEGALRVRRGDRSVYADVAARIAGIDPHGVVTRFYSYEAVLPYGSRSLLYDHAAGTVSVLSDQATARRLLSSGSAAEGCVGGPGVGAVELPFDVAFGWLHSRLPPASS